MRSPSGIGRSGGGVRADAPGWTFATLAMVVALLVWPAGMFGFVRSQALVVVLCVLAAGGYVAYWLHRDHQRRVALAAAARPVVRDEHGQRVDTEPSPELRAAMAQAELAAQPTGDLTRLVDRLPVTKVVAAALGGPMVAVLLATAFVLPPITVGAAFLLYGWVMPTALMLQGRASSTETAMTHFIARLLAWSSGLIVPWTLVRLHDAHGWGLGLL